MSSLESLELLAVTLAPIGFIFTYVYLRDKYEREPLKYLIITFLLGVLTAAPVIFLGEGLRMLTGTSSTSATLLGLFVYAFFVVAMTEEGMKYLVLRFYNYPHKEFDEPYDGIMYGAAVSLGFAAIENVLYVFGPSEDQWGVAIVRMFTAVPAHATFGIIMGYFVGRAKFLGKEGNPFMERMKGLGLAIVLHGVYDFFLFVDQNRPKLEETAVSEGASFTSMLLSVNTLIPLGIIAFISLVIGILFSRRAMKQHVAISPHKGLSNEA